MKRLLDIILALLGLAILLLPFTVIIIVLKLTGERQAWFLQERVGLNGRVFKVFKFITMRTGAEATGSKDITVRDDPRVLPVGRFLRKTKLNELPQFINVLLGDMSLVGWRPLMPVSFSLYEPELQEGIVRAKPGLTGLGSIVFRDEETIVSEAGEQGKDLRRVYAEDIMPYKGRLEIWYAEHQSVGLDLKILLATLLAIVLPGSVFYQSWFKGLPEPESPLVRKHLGLPEQREVVEPLRILVITQFFTPDITAAAFRLADTATLLVREGHEVCVVTAEPHKGRAEGDSGEHPLPDGLRIERCPIKPILGTGARAYTRHYLSFLRSSIARGWRIRRSGWRPDVVFASSPPLFTGLSGRIVAGLFRCPLVLDIRDVWPDSAVAAGQLAEDGFAYKIGRWLERYLYRKARHISCVANPMREYIVSQTKTPVTVAYNGVWRDAASETLGRMSATVNERTLLYAGNLGHVQELNLLVTVFAALRREGRLKAWRLRLIGAGVQRDNLANQIAELDATEYISLEPPVSRKRVADEFARADALFLNLKRDRALEKTIPSKVFDYLVAARPIVAGLIGEGRDVLESTGANVCCDPGSEDALRGALEEVNQRFAELDRMAPMNQRLVLERFTREVAAELLLKVFKSVTGRVDYPLRQHPLEASPVDTARDCAASG